MGEGDYEQVAGWTGVDVGADLKAAAEQQATASSVV
jgi:hypothetical protein